MIQFHTWLRHLFYSLLVISLLFLSGCWSRREIENISLTVGMALDKGEVTQLEKKLKDRGGSYPKKNLITVTYQVVNPIAAAGGKGGKGGSSQQKAYTNISETGDSLHEITREFSLRRDRPIFGGHFKIIVIGEGLARTKNLQQFLDYYIRENAFRPSTLVFISNGRASKILELKDPSKIPSLFLLGISDNNERVRGRTNRSLPPMPLIKLIEKMQSQSSFLLQNVISTDGEMKFAGAGVIRGKSNKLAGFINEADLEGLNWITGNADGWHGQKH